MTIPSTPRRAGPFTGNGATTSFPFAFKVFAPTDVKVVVANSAGVETVLVLNSDYSVSLNANQDTSPGGTITYPISGSPLPSGSVLSIIGNIDYSQPLDLPSGGNFSPLALENQLDRTTMQIQQLREEMDRTAKLPPTSSESVEDLVDDLQRIADSANNLDAVAGSIGNVNTVATNIADVQTVAANVADVTNFADVYQGGKPSDPTLRNDGSALQPGDLYFNTTSGTLAVYHGSGWAGLNSAAVWGPARTLTIGNTGKSVDGSANVSWSLAEIGGDASVTNYLPAGTGAVATTVQSKLQEFVSVKDFGAVGDGVADDTAAIQLCIDAANPVGAIVYFPPGEYKVTSALTIDNTGDTDATAPKASIVGAGKTSVRILAGAGDYSVIRLLGGAVSAGVHSHQKIEGISITKAGGNGDGIYLSNIAYFAMRDVLVLGAAVGLRGVDVLSSYITGCQFLFNTRGVDFVRSELSDGYQSGPNALTFVGCVLGNNGNSGGYFRQGGCINFIGGSIEGNGISGSGTSAEKFGLLINNSGLESAVGLNVFGTYFEANKGTADVWLANAAHSVTHSLTGATFNRVDSVNHVSHNVFVETSGAISTDVRLNGCGFTGLGTYEPSGARLTIHQVASSGGRNRLSWDGCYFSSTVDAPVARNYSAAVAAFGAVTAAGALVGGRMNVGSVVRNAAGDYTITYAQPLENSRPAAIATPYGDALATVFGISDSIIRFRFLSRATGALVDTDFSFVVMGR